MKTASETVSERTNQRSNEQARGTIVVSKGVYLAIVWVRISDPRSLGSSWCIKGADESSRSKDLLVPFGTQ